MTSIIKVTPLSGAQDESPPCYLLQIDDFGILLDCGWDENFNMQYIDLIKKHLHQIDAVLLSYPDPPHLGALPYLVGKVGLDCPIYATFPVYKMGQMFMYDVYQSRKNSEEFDIFTLDDVDAAFEKIQHLKYSQSISFKGKGQGLVITPLPAGHMLGGTIWKIVKDGEEEVVYMVDYNHKKERHLNGCMLDSIGRPQLLITDAYNADYAHARRRLRDEQLMTHIIQTMRNDGNVLICVDTAGRVLELAQLLDQMWRSQESGLMTYSLALINNVSYNTVQFAKSQVEWMSDKIMRAFEDRRNNPFQFRHVQLCHNLTDLAKVPDPKVVLASGPDMECGYSRDLFVQWCSNPRNTIVLTNRTSPGTLARFLIDNPGKQKLSLQVRQRVRLSGKDLEDFILQKKEKEAEERRLKAEKIKREKQELESSSESEDEEDQEYVLGKTRHDLMIKSESKSKAGFFKQAKKSHLIFPAVEERIKWDEYGEIIRPEDFMVVDNPVQEEVKTEVTTKTNKEEPTTPVLEELPTQCISVKETFDVEANVIFIDFEGRSDGESMRKIVTQIKPRMLVLIGGNPGPTHGMAEYCRSKDIQHVFTPRVLQVVDATSESRIYQVKLLDSVVSRLHFAKAHETELAWIEAVLSRPEKHEFKDYDDEDMDTDEDTMMVLKTTPELLSKGHTAVYINEPKLMDFKQVLQNRGIQAEFSAGALICNNVVAVRRNEAGRLVLEGCLSDDYYVVRDLLYAQYAIV
jgi:cleavage and polyadenylation specificity factor subunit 2